MKEASAVRSAAFREGEDGWLNCSQSHSSPREVISC